MLIIIVVARLVVNAFENKKEYINSFREVLGYIFFYI